MTDTPTKEDKTADDGYAYPFTVPVSRAAAAEIRGQKALDKGRAATAARQRNA